MEYTALYRKLRSQRFEDMVGQEHIVKTLKNQIVSGRISHAYLFCGIRGTGKTSAARILSRALNCENPQGGEPCNVCPTCVEIFKERSVNVFEIDGASHTGVDKVRDLIEDCYYPPTSGRYKIYIIDEVHMLSTSAFNAFLKTLEEPPKHVVFILATTDPQKLPQTVHSRCQRFDFKRITSSDIFAHLKKYTDAENIDITDEALRHIALASDGAMRDAQNILEQCISFFFGERITLDNVLELLGAVDTSVFFELADALYMADSAKCMSLIEDAVLLGRDIGQFVTGFITHLRNILVCAQAGENAPVDASAENIKKMREQGIKIDRITLVNFISEFAQLFGKIKYLPNERAMLEVCCIKLCNPKTEDNYDTLFSRIKILERLIEEGNFVTGASSGINGEVTGKNSDAGASSAANGEDFGGSKKNVASKENRSAKAEKQKPPEVTPDNIKDLIEGWGDFLAKNAEAFTPLTLELFKGAQLSYKDRGLTIAFDYGNNAGHIKITPEDLKDKMSSFFGYCCPLRYGQKVGAKNTRLDNGISDAEAEQLRNMLPDVDIITQ
ncbi:MAG: DNA polymerase III subunit gamma/tau [Clostridiales bacterium]|jgi:DNA polymerase-3 subunit gamma/tau|nr:DNA polymerase III subunit gamma/tau [Clostridiales bacterium]